MAIVLDINLLSIKLVDMDVIGYLIKKYNVGIASINSIDNWKWENKKEIESLLQIGEVLNNYQIIIIELKQPLIKDVGIYIEKVENLYHYTVWMNTEGYPMLDCNIITLDNCKYFENLISALLKMKEDDINIFEVVAIGLETDIYYSKDVFDMIQKSKNILVWILNQNVELNQKIDGYEIKKRNGIKVLEKMKC